MMKRQVLPIASIYVPVKRRATLDPAKVQTLAESILEAGQSTPILVRQDGERFVLVTAPDARPYVRMIVERLFPTLPVLSHVEIAKGVELRILGTIS